MAVKGVSEMVVRRLPLYLRTLTFLAAEGRKLISSQELGERLGISPAQIRKDLSYFGEFGKQGSGYEVEYLKEQLERILNVDKEWELALVGAGDLGHALILHYGGFEGRGFRITTVFDKDPQKIGKKIGDLEILDSKLLPKIIKERGIQLAIIAVPTDEAQEVADELVKAGIKGILSYAPIILNVPPEVRVQCIDPVIRLQRITYYLDK